MEKMNENRIRSTTVICVRKDGKAAMVGDGQVSLGNTVMKGGAKKVRRLHKDAVVVGFAGATADAVTLLERFEAKLQEHSGNLKRSAVELAKDWRTNKILRHLEAMMIVADKEESFLVTGNGDVIEPDDGLLAIGSGGPFALSAARALMRHTSLTAREVAEESLKIAGEVCVFTNDRLVVEEI